MNEWRQDERVSERKEIKNWFRSLIYNTTRKGERKSTKNAKRFEWTPIKNICSLSRR